MSEDARAMTVILSDKIYVFSIFYTEVEKNTWANGMKGYRAGESRGQVYNELVVWEQSKKFCKTLTAQSSTGGY
jgi:hypothetical protein